MLEGVAPLAGFCADVPFAVADALPSSLVFADPLATGCFTGCALCAVEEGAGSRVHPTASTHDSENPTAAN